MHCTKSEHFFSMVASGSLEPTECKWFKEHLNYLFYGRPAYRPYQDAENTSLEAFRPVAIIFEPDYNLTLKRVFPFDTGAFFEHRYEKFISNHTRIENFQADPDTDSASRLVSMFFRSNKDYYFSRSTSPSNVAPTNLVVSSLSGMFQSRGLSEVDDRRSTIEVQVADCIALNKRSVMAVCMPGVYCEDDKLYEMITKDWDADIVDYDIYYDSPLHDLREVMARVKDYLNRKNFL